MFFAFVHITRHFFIIEKRSLGDAAGPRGHPFPPMPHRMPPPGHLIDEDEPEEEKPPAGAPWGGR